MSTPPTAEEEIERVRRLHGDAAAEVARRFIANPEKPKRQRSAMHGWRVGVKAKPRKGIARSRGFEPAWREREGNGLSSPFPYSGAPEAPAPRPRKDEL